MENIVVLTNKDRSVLQRDEHAFVCLLLWVHYKGLKLKDEKEILGYNTTE